MVLVIGAVLNRYLAEYISKDKRACCYWPPVCSWYTSMTSSCSISRAFGVSSSLILLPSNRNLRDVTGTPTLSLYDFFSFPICVVCFTRKWISFESCPTTFNLIYSVSDIFKVGYFENLLTLL